MIKESEIEKSIEELENSKSVKVEIEVSTWEAYSLIVAFQLFKAKGSNLLKVLSWGEMAARKLHRVLGHSCPRTYILLDNGWNLTESEPKKN
jgi:hypothetical protein